MGQERGLSFTLIFGPFLQYVRDSSRVEGRSGRSTCADVPDTRTPTMGTVSLAVENMEHLFPSTLQIGPAPHQLMWPNH